MGDTNQGQNYYLFIEIQKMKNIRKMIEKRRERNCCCVLAPSPMDDDDDDDDDAGSISVTVSHTFTLYITQQ